MVKIIKKKFFEVDLPLIGAKFESLCGSIDEINNQTIKIDNLNNKFCKIKQNNKWITADKNEPLKKIFNRACEIVSMCIMENKDMYKEAQLETINGYIEKDFDDEIIIETVKKLALDIYNFYNTSI